MCLVVLSLDANAQGSFSPGASFSVGDGKLTKPYTSDLGISLDINGYLNYVNGVFLADAGFGGILLNDKRKPAYYGSTSAAQLFLEIPIGLGAILDVGNHISLIIGSEVSFLYSAGGSGIYYELSPHIDLLWRTKGGNQNGFFLKGAYNFAGGDDRYQPRYFGIGFKGMFRASQKKTSKPKTSSS